MPPAKRKKPIRITRENLLARIPTPAEGPLDEMELAVGVHFGREMALASDEHFERVIAAMRSARAAW